MVDRTRYTISRIFWARSPVKPGRSGRLARTGAEETYGFLSTGSAARWSPRPGSAGVVTAEDTGDALHTLTAVNRSKAKDSRFIWALPFVVLAVMACTTGEDAHQRQSDNDEPATDPNPSVVPVPELGDSPLADTTPPKSSQLVPALGSSSETPLVPTPYESQVEPKQHRSARVQSPTYVMDAILRWPGQPKTPTLSSLPREDQQRATVSLSRQITVEFGAGGNLKLTIVGGGLPLPQGSTLFADAKHYGHILVWPDEERYRVLPPGSLMAVLQEYRPDVAPLVNAKIAATEEKKERRFGYPLSKTRIETERGTVTFQSIQMLEAGASGPLLCRLLLDVLAIAPTLETCAATQLPVEAVFETPSGDVEFHADSLRPLPEGTTATLFRPRKARFVTAGLPDQPGAFVSKSVFDLLVGSREANAAGRLEVFNDSDIGAYLLWNGIPLSYLTPRSQKTFERVRRGAHELELRGTFGDVVLERRSVEVSDETQFGPPKPKPDAGLPE